MQSALLGFLLLPCLAAGATAKATRCAQDPVAEADGLLGLGLRREALTVLGRAQTAAPGEEALRLALLSVHVAVFEIEPPGEATLARLEDVLDAALGLVESGSPGARTLAVRIREALGEARSDLALEEPDRRSDHLEAAARHFRGALALLGTARPGEVGAAKDTAEAGVRRAILALKAAAAEGKGADRGSDLDEAIYALEGIALRHEGLGPGLAALGALAAGKLAAGDVRGGETLLRQLIDGVDTAGIERDGGLDRAAQHLLEASARRLGRLLNAAGRSREALAPLEGVLGLLDRAGVPWGLEGRLAAAELGRAHLAAGDAGRGLQLLGAVIRDGRGDRSGRSACRRLGEALKSGRIASMPPGPVLDEIVFHLIEEGRSEGMRVAALLLRMRLLGESRPADDAAMDWLRLGHALELAGDAAGALRSLEEGYRATAGNTGHAVRILESWRRLLGSRPPADGAESGRVAEFRAWLRDHLPPGTDARGFRVAEAEDLLRAGDVAGALAILDGLPREGGAGAAETARLAARIRIQEAERLGRTDTAAGLRLLDEAVAALGGVGERGASGPPSDHGDRAWLAAACVERARLREGREREEDVARALALTEEIPPEATAGDRTFLLRTRVRAALLAGRIEDAVDATGRLEGAGGGEAALASHRDCGRALMDRAGSMSAATAPERDLRDRARLRALSHLRTWALGASDATAEDRAEVAEALAGLRRWDEVEDLVRTAGAAGAGSGTLGLRVLGVRRRIEAARAALAAGDAGAASDHLAAAGRSLEEGWARAAGASGPAEPEALARLRAQVLGGLAAGTGAAGRVTVSPGQGRFRDAAALWQRIAGALEARDRAGSEAWWEARFHVHLMAWQMARSDGDPAARDSIATALRLLGVLHPEPGGAEWSRLFAWLRREVEAR